MSGIPCEVIIGGQPVAYTIEGYMDGGVLIPLGSAEQVKVSTPPPPPPATLGYVGCYSDSDQNVKDWFGEYPQVSSTYYQPGQQNISLAAETSRINRGTSPNLTITTKGTDLLERIYDNESTAMTWLTTYVNQLKKLSEVDPDIPVYATLVHEPTVQINNGVSNPANGLTGRSAQPAVIGGAQGRFFHLCDQLAPLVKKTWWIVGFNRTIEAQIAQAWNAQNPDPTGDSWDPDVVQWDPYANGPNDSIDTITSADIAWIKGQSWYKDQPLALGEFGMPVANGDAAMTTFFTNVSAKLAAKGLLYGIFFDRPRDNNHQITVGTPVTGPMTYPGAVAAFDASLAAGPHRT